MADKRFARSDVEPVSLEKIKRLVIVAMFSDDELMDQLVVKGGNALDIIYGVSTRASIDVDFSMQGDFPGGSPAFCKRVEQALERTFIEVNFQVFDVNIAEKPKAVSDDVADFWGGYAIQFKLVDVNKYNQLHGDIEKVRRCAVTLGKGTRFLIDVSKYEYVEKKEARLLDGYQVFVYSGAMVVVEKLRAICQQMPEYLKVVHRGRPGTARARDFVDIHTVVTALNVDMTSPENKALLGPIFEAKRVELGLLEKISEYRDFHRVDFDGVLQTVKADVKLEGFDFYFDFVLDLINKLKPFGNV